MGTLPKNDQDQRGAIKYLRFQFSLQCAMLSWCQLKIKDRTIAIMEVYQFSDFLDFSRAEQCTGVRAGQALYNTIKGYDKDS